MKIKFTQLRRLVTTFLLVAAMVMPSTAQARTITPVQPGGKGTASFPYFISTAEELYWFAGLVNGDASVCINGISQNRNAWAVLWRDITVNSGVLKADGTLAGDVSSFAQWTPIGNDQNPFTGNFDGKGHTISGLYFNNNTGSSNVGLFGYINKSYDADASCTIQNVGIVDSYFNGYSCVGSVCGCSYFGTISNCYNTGTVIATDYHSGGICGLSNYSSIEKCYNTGSVEGYTIVGGVAGQCMYGSITNCYNTGSVKGVGTASAGVGGVCDIAEGSEVTNCYNIGTLSGQTVGNVINSSCETLTNSYYLADGETDEREGTTAMSADQFANGEVAWLLNGKRSEGTTGNPLAWYQDIKGDSYPVLDSRHGTVYASTPCPINFSNTENKAGEHLFGENDNGFCHNCGAYQPATLTTDKYDIDGNDTKDKVYEIGNAGQLYWFAGLVNGDTNVCDYNADTNPEGTQQNKAACAVLTANIVVNSGIEEGKTMLESLGYDDSGNVTNGSSFVAWTPIGFNCQYYTGTFDGKGYTVSGLYFNDTSKEMVGLFGRVDSGGKISNVGVLDSYFLFSMFGGGVCGRNDGEISNCYNSSTVVETSGSGYAGGVCGYNVGGKVLNSYNNGIISGSTNTGGVCGFNQSNGEITNCYNSGTVSGKGETNQIAGVCGYNDRNCTISGCYNTGTVSGKNLGGLCGDNYGTVKNCYNTGTVSGQNICGGVCSTNNMYGTVTSCYNRGVVSGTGTQVGGICGTTSSTSSTTNCYYDIDIYSGNAIGVNNAGTVDNVMGKTTKQFNSGEVAYLLAQGCKVGETFYDGSVWGQQLGENDYPVLGSAYKVLMAARDGLEGSIYWATFSNLNSNAELIDPKGDITVYNATVSSGTLTLAKRMDNKVSSREGVLLKANSEYVNAKNISDYVDATTGENDLLATPKDAGVLNDTNYKHYRLTYNDVDSKEGIGFYLGVVKDETGNVTSNDGSQIRVTPGKAYLKVSTQAATEPSTAKLARGFAFPGDGETTGIECITVTDESLHSNGNAEGIFDLQGRKVSKPTKGVYINNGKTVIIK